MFMFPAGGEPNLFGAAISKSVRFDGAASYMALTRAATPGTNYQKGTLSMWVKRSGLTGGSYHHLFGHYAGASDYRFFGFNTDDTLIFTCTDGGVSKLSATTTTKFRDVGNWYHFFIAYDTTLATAADRVKLYVNGVQHTLSATMTQNTTYGLAGIEGVAWQSLLGVWAGPTYYFPGYMAECYGIDGVAHAVTDFGMTNPLTGEWVPKTPTGLTYGVHGWHLDFADNSSAAALGNDASGGADFSVAGLSVTAGVDNDSLTDTPTNNHCTFNPVMGATDSTISDGALKVLTANGDSGAVTSTFAFPATGKWYYEVGCTSNGGAALIGIKSARNANTTVYAGSDSDGYGYYAADGNKYNNGTGAAYGSTWTSTDILGVAFDADNGKLWFAKNGTWQASGDPAAGTNAAFTGLTGNIWLPAVSDGSSGSTATYYGNFGQRAFAYTAPTGFKKLCARDMPKPTIKDGSKAAAVATWTGNGSTQNITGLAFAPDLVFIKCRNNTRDWRLFDTTRGALKEIYTSSTAAEVTETDSLTAFNSDGFSLGADAGVNTNAETFAAWCLKEGATYGIDVVTQTAPASGNITVNHSLGTTPKFVFAKSLAGGTANFPAWFSGMGTDHMYLNLTDAPIASGYMVSQDATTFVIAINFFNVSQPMVTYLFAEVPGFSRIGKYTANGAANGPFAWCGFRPAFVMMKRTNAAGGWRMHSSALADVADANLNDNHLEVNTTAAVDANGSALDFLSNGFKMRANDSINASGDYYFIAFADSPFRYNRAR